MRYAVRRMTDEDAVFLSRLLRDRDLEECHVLEVEPDDCMFAALDLSSEAWVGLVCGVPAVAFGVVETSLLAGEATPWLFVGRLASRDTKTLLRLSRRWVSHLLTRYDRLVDLVPEGDLVALRWLRWLGFEVVGREGTMLVVEAR